MCFRGFLRAVSRAGLLLSGLLAFPAGAGLSDSEDWERGVKALEDGLPEVALQCFEGIRGNGLNGDEEGELELKRAVAETLCGKPAAALRRLDRLAGRGGETGAYWRARALLASGRVGEALGVFGELFTASDADIRRAAFLSRVGVLGGTGRGKEALDLLGKRPDGVEAMPLREAALLLEAGETNRAAEILGKLPDEGAVKLYLEARVGLARKDWDAAREKFGKLLEKERLRAALHDGAMLGMARGLREAGEKEQAADFLAKTLEKWPESRILSGLFMELEELAEGSKTLEKRLQEWAGDRRNGERAQRALLLLGRLAERKGTAKELRTALGFYGKLREETGSADGLAERAALREAGVLLALGEAGRAAEALATLGKTAKSPLALAEARFALGLLQAGKEDPGTAAASFARAREALRKAGESGLAERAAFNEAVMWLWAGDFGKTSGAKGMSAELRRDLEMERLLWLAKQKGGVSLGILAKFLEAPPDHKKLAEVSLALAEAALGRKALEMADPDSRMGKAEGARFGSLLREALELAKTKAPPKSRALRHALARLRLAELTEEGSGMALVDSLDLPEALSRLLRLRKAEGYFLNEDYNKARMLFLRLAKEARETGFRRRAKYFAARAALKIGTKEARKEGLGLLASLVSGNDGDKVGRQARMTTGRFHLAAGRAAKALEALETPGGKTGAAAEKDTPEALHLLFLRAEAYYALGTGKGAGKALGIYESLLSLPGLPGSWRNRACYLRGLALERLGRRAEALAAWHGVIARPPRQGASPEEWKYYFRPGFRALAVLEESKRWKAALALAERMAAAQGPRSQEAAQRSATIRERHHLWE